MILSDIEIRELCKSDTPLIDNFDEDKLQGASYDICISNKIDKFKGNFRTISLSQSEIDDMFIDHTMPESGYVMAPGEYILAQIAEKVSLPNYLAAHIRPRSRFTRMGIIITDQHINPTYSGNFRVGILNATPFAVTVAPGLVIAQIVFEELKSVPSEEKQYKNQLNAEYHNEKDFRGAKIDKSFLEKYDQMIKQLMRGE